MQLWLKVWDDAFFNAGFMHPSYGELIWDQIKKKTKFLLGILGFSNFSDGSLEPLREIVPTIDVYKPRV